MARRSRFGHIAQRAKANTPNISYWNPVHDSNTGGYRAPGLMMPIDNAGNLDDRYKLDYGAPITADRAGVDELKNIALSEGPSMWAQLMNQRADQQAQDAMSQINAQNQANQTAGLDRLASTGGVSNASRERMATAGNNQAMKNQLVAQNAARLAKQDIGIQDEQMRRQALGQLNQAELAFAGDRRADRQAGINVQDQNINRALAGIGEKNKYQTDMWKTMMGDLGARKTAAAQHGAARQAKRSAFDGIKDKVNSVTKHFGIKL